MAIHKVSAAVALALASLLVSISGVARATVLTYGANDEFSGATAPRGSSPWFTVAIDDNDVAESVTFALTATDLSGAEDSPSQADLMNETNHLEYILKLHLGVRSCTFVAS